MNRFFSVDACDKIMRKRGRYDKDDKRPRTGKGKRERTHFPFGFLRALVVSIRSAWSIQSVRAGDTTCKILGAVKIVSANDRTGFFYIKSSRTLLVGIPKDNIIAVQNPKTVAFFPIQQMLKTARLHIRDVENIAFTTTENFDDITEQEDAKEDLWDEFMEYIREKKRRKSGGEVLQFKVVKDVDDIDKDK